MIRGLGRLPAVVVAAGLLLALAAGGVSAADPSAPPPGPPFPAPVDGRYVYDFAGILSPGTVAGAQKTIEGIRDRTGAQVVVYTQASGESELTPSETMAKARALIDQWGVGRRGFDDGLVIFVDLDETLRHGQVQLYAGGGYQNAYLSESERQAIFDNDMLPLLQAGDFDGAISAAMAAVDAAATPEHAQQLEGARQVNAVVGLVGAPIVFLGLVGWVVLAWRRYGKDPVYLDDPSVLMPAPPPDLTAASGAMVMDGGTSRRALTTAMLDLASRGLIAFREGEGGSTAKVGVDTQPDAGDATIEAQRARNARRPIGPAEEVALTKLRQIGNGAEDGVISATRMPEFGASVNDFDKALEDHVVDRGWFTEKPSKVVARWMGRGVLAVVAGVVAIIAGVNVPISGLVLLGAAAVAGGIVVIILAQSMPAVTMPGAMIRAMLAAYRRTLKATMAQARSMQQVVDEAGLAWLDTPDQAVVWGTALGLQGDIEHVLERSLQDVQQGRSGTVPYFPIWYQTSSGASAFTGGGGGGGSMFSGSAIPDLGGMMAALGTIGNSPPSSSSGGGGGFGGGGGGGGGGAGGGF